MTHYRPILKAKPGEFEALGNLSRSARRGLTPVLEICPEPDNLAAISKVIQKATSYLGGSGPVCIDSSYLPHTVGHVVVPVSIANGLAALGVPVIPVVHMGSTPAELSSAATIAIGHTQTAALRVLVNSAGFAPAFTAVNVSAIAASLTLASTAIDLIIDFGAADASITSSLPAAEALLTTASTTGPWRSVTVSAGAFPQSISHLVPGIRHDIHRYDAALWRGLSARDYHVDFGDYAVNHPEIATGGRGPLPNLRYTNGRLWSIWREAKTRPGNESFFDLCKKVLIDPAWSGAAFSWGDEQIDLKAAEATPKAGTATQWRAYGTSHHLTTVVDRLASLGEP